MPRVFSECRGIPKEDCPQRPKCIYTNGQRYQYCTLSRRYKLDKETGEAILRQTRRNKAALKQMLLEVESAKAPTPPAKEPKMVVDSSLNRTRKINLAKDRVRRFLRNTTFKRKANYLLKKCLDSGLCLAFGKEAKRIKDLFRNFQGLAFIQPPIKQIGQPSSNGFVHEIHYKRQGYDAYTVLKSSASIFADNLYYEYLIGKILNELIYVLPHFVETYGLYSYKDETAWKHAENTRVVTTNSLFDGLQNVEEIFPKESEKLRLSCSQPKHMAIMIQHLKEVRSLGDAFKDQRFLSDELAYVLFQVYATLYATETNFTHYDLHPGNVLLYQPVKDTYIQYHYHFANGREVVFKCFYMAKIIDYGRSYISIDSPKIFDKVCKICKPDCGNDAGYGWLNSAKNSKADHYISSRFSNVSHDLRLLKSIQNIVKEDALIVPVSLEKVLKKVVYKTKYGTPERKDSGLPRRIHNVTDAFIELRNYIWDAKTQIAHKDAFHGKTNKLGDLHIYVDEMKAMQFIRTKI